MTRTRWCRIPGPKLRVRAKKVSVTSNPFGTNAYTPLYSGVFWDVRDYLLEDIDRIEDISGPLRRGAGSGARGN